MLRIQLACMNSLCIMQVYIVIEMVLLLFIGLSLVLRLVWKGPKRFLRSRNTLIVSNTTYAYTHYTQVTVLQVVVLLFMFMEALAILSRNQRHFRITRFLRPLLLLDNYLMAGARRYNFKHSVVRSCLICNTEE